MARVNVEGTVSRLNQTGNGFGLKETREHQGKTYTTYWSVFPPRDQDPQVNVGDVVKVDGFLRTEVSKRDARYVDHTIGQATITRTQPQAPAEPWGGSYGDDSPF